ncbi:MAG: M48 family metallopeptidase [bacterium]|nr:M48 family metallopeptidase [bacterium]MDZ4296445.1 M48 family metallopeptidase [Patescibacteria group bacterium]
MEYVLEVAGNGRITYAVRRSSRARLLRLTVYRDGRVVVTLPQRLGARHAERFIREKAAWVLAKVTHVKTQKPRYLFRGGIRQYLRHKTWALALVRARLAFFNAHYGFAYGRVMVRNQRTRWGSCSKERNLSFNWRIVFLPQALQDYLVVHELCHLAALDHSARFWALVAEKIPNYGLLRRDLKQRY